MPRWRMRRRACVVPPMSKTESSSSRVRTAAILEISAKRRFGFANGDGGAGHNSGNGQGNRGGPYAVAVEGTREAVGEAVGTGGYGEEILEAPEVGGELFDGFVTAGGFFAEGFEENVFEVGGDGRDVSARSNGRRLGDGVGEAEGTGLRVVGQMAGEHLVKDNAERVNVGSRSGGFSPDLFRAGVFRSEGGVAGESAWAGAVEQGGDPEVKQLGYSFGRNEDVARLDVPMGDQVAVDVRDGGADDEEEFRALGDGEVGVGEVLGEGDAVDIVHDEERAAVGRGTAIEEAGNVGVIEPREDAALLFEAVGCGACGAGVQDLDGDNLLHVFNRAQGAVDGAHAAGADGFEDAVLGKAAGGVEGWVGVRGYVRERALLPGGVDIGGGGGAEESFDFGAQGRVGRGVSIEEGAASVGGQGDGLFEQALDLFKAIQCICATRPLQNSSRVRLCE